MPTRDPDDGEIDDVDEFLNTLDAVEHDEALLSLLGEGRNLDVPGDVVDQQLANALSSWRDDGDREPVRDEAIGQKHPQGGEWPLATTGGTVSVQDEAERLRALASSQEIPIEILHQASARLDGLMAQVREILGSVSVHLGPLEGLVQEVKGALATAIGAGQQFETALHNAADAHARGWNVELFPFIRNPEYGKQPRQLVRELDEVVEESIERNAYDLDTEDQEWRERNIQEARSRLN